MTQNLNNLEYGIKIIQINKWWGNINYSIYKINKMINRRLIFKEDFETQLINYILYSTYI